MLRIGFSGITGALGGPETFKTRIIKYLNEMGYDVIYPKDNGYPDVILVTPGTKRLLWLLTCKLRGSKIVHRLDGINWLHRVNNSSLLDKLKAEIKNWNIKLIRNYFADYVIYQSEFVYNWWHKEYGSAPCPEKIIYNGTDLNLFNSGKREKIKSPVLLCVEGNIVEDRYTLNLITKVTNILINNNLISATKICGNLSIKSQNYLESQQGIEVLGKVNRKQMPEIYAASDIFLSLDINSACPNAVIEALASGLPVVGYDTGALKELVTPESGIIVPFGGNPWKLDEPKYENIADAIKIIIGDLNKYSIGARNLAENKLSHRNMCENYISIFNKITNVNLLS